WGQYAMLFLAPTGLVLVTLQMLGIQFNKWVKFVLPMVGFVLGFGALMLVAQVMMA
ncbi:MAG: YfcC family protein, partial [Aeromonas allosaccharophila]